MTESQREKERRKRWRKRAAILDEQAATVHLCAYCAGQLVLVSDSAVYQKSYGGHVWMCVPCDAWVGCHRGGYLPKGRVAKADLRKLKIEAHRLFDRLWRAAIELRGWTQHDARKAAYQWLAEAMGIDVKLCHIGMFDEAQTRQVIEICGDPRAHRKELISAAVGHRAELMRSSVL